MKRLVQLLILLMPLGAASCGSDVVPDPVPDPTVGQMSSTPYLRDLCEIYAAIMTSRYKSKIYVINTDPDTFPCGKNDSSGKAGFPFPFDGTGKYILISDAEREAIFKNDGDGWARFREMYPDSNGIIQLGPVEINNERTQAVASASGMCGLTCGSGAEFTLHKKDGVWFVFSEAGGWVS